MTGAVLEFASPERVDDAWEALRKHREPIIANPKLLLNRDFVETDARLEDRFKRLYLRGCR